MQDLVHGRIDVYMYWRSLVSSTHAGSLVQTDIPYKMYVKDEASVFFTGIWVSCGIVHCVAIWSSFNQWKESHKCIKITKQLIPSFILAFKITF